MSVNTQENGEPNIKMSGLSAFRKAFGIRVKETQIGQSDCLRVFVYCWFQADEAAPSKNVSEKQPDQALGGGAEAAPSDPTS